METKTPTVGVENGLHPLSEDVRDFSLAGVFDQIDVKEIPLENFVVAHPLAIKDQGATDYCSAFAVTETSEDQEEIELLPQYQFFKTKVLMNDFESWGANLRSACKSAAKFGSLPVKNHEHYLKLSRSQILDPVSWPEELDKEAKQYKKETFFKVDGRYDTFDNIRCAMWQHRTEKRSIIVGAVWRDEWTAASDGIVPEGEFEGGYGHAFKIFGQRIINGQPYLIAQLSNGTWIGDGGQFYFPRSVANREFTPYGQFMFKDISRETAEFYLSNPVTTQSPWYKRIGHFLKHLISNHLIT